MKAVLISIQPKWIELICSSKKTIELRKSKPTLETPFKVYIYETQGRTETPFIDEDGHEIFKGRGRVIGEFICDDIDTVGAYNGVLYCVKNSQPDKLKQMCLSYEEVKKYLGEKNIGYGWHISDLVIYDDPIGLSEFTKYGLGELVPWKRPPQSWGYCLKLLPPLAEPKGKTIKIPKWTYKGETE